MMNFGSKVFKKKNVLMKFNIRGVVDAKPYFTMTLGNVLDYCDDYFRTYSDYPMHII